MRIDQTCKTMITNKEAGYDTGDESVLELDYLCLNPS
jgi:hypothetical protein